MQLTSSRTRRWVLSLACACALLAPPLAPPAVAQTRQVFATEPGDYIRLLWGLLGFGTNEVSLRSTVDDPPKFVLESISGSLGAWSARYVLPNGGVVELGLVQYKKDERTRGRDDLLWGEWTVHLRGQPTSTDDDGMRLVFLATHDYVWIKGLSSTASPAVPRIELPPLPPASDDPWLTPEAQRRHSDELDAIAAEFAAVGGPEFVPDEKTREAYLIGRNRNLKSIHDDMVQRAGFDPGPHPPGAPY
jgi:hypothetical protein